MIFRKCQLKKLFNQMKMLRALFEFIGILIIVGSMTLAGSLMAAFVYILWESTIIAFSIVALWFIAGLIWAIRISKKYGALEWLSDIRRIS